MRRIATMGVLVGLVIVAVGCKVPDTLPEGTVVMNKDAVSAVTKAGQMMTVDGVLGEKAWRNACALTDFTVGQTGKPEVQTRVLVTYDDENLYVAVINFEPNTDQLKADAEGHDGNVWSDDSVEIYVDADNAKQGTSGYKGFFVNSKNARYDRTEDESWDPEWKSATSVLPAEAWIVEVALPMKTLEITAKAGHKLGLMVARNRLAGVSQTLYLVPCSDEAKDTDVYPVLELK